MEDKRRNGYLAACRKYGKGYVVSIIRRKAAEKARGYNVLSPKQETRKQWDSIEAKARDIYGKWY